MAPPSLHRPKSPSLIPTPQQTRSRESYGRIIRATKDLLEERSFEEISITEILQRSRVSSGSFYARFGSKEMVLRCLHAEYRDELRALVESTIVSDHVDRSLTERIERLVNLQIQRMSRQRGLLRTLVLRRRELSPEDAVAVQEVTLDSFRACESYILRSASEILHLHPRRSVRFALFVMTTACSETMLFGDQPPSRALRASAESLTKSLTPMLLGFLRPGVDPDL